MKQPNNKNKASTKSTPKKSVGNVDTAWRGRFLELLGTTCNVTLAAKGAGVDRKTVYNHYKAFPDFAAEWDDAKEAAVEILEAEAWNRARKQSDVLMIFLLKAHKPGMYRERHQVDINPIDWSLIPDDVLDAYCEGQMTEEDVRRVLIAQTHKH